MRSLFFWSLFQIKIKVQFRSSVFLSDNHWNRNLKRGVGSLSTAQKNICYIWKSERYVYLFCESAGTAYLYVHQDRDIILKKTLQLTVTVYYRQKGGGETHVCES